MSKPKISSWAAIAIVIGCVIGSGVFVKPGRVLIAAGNSTGALYAWLLGGLITLASGLTVAELSARIPKTGGVYAYMEELYGRTWGFVCGWVQSVIYGPALMSALSLYFASLFAQYFSLDSGQIKPIAFIAMFLLASISAVSMHYSSMISSATTILKLLPIAAIGVLGLMNGAHPIFGQASTSAPALGLGAAILSTLWAYDGWIQIANLAGEMKDPAKNLPKTIIIGLCTVIVAYLLVNLSLFHTLPADQVGTLNEKAAAAASEILFGSVGGKILSLGILVSIFGCLNGNILAMTRVPYAMAIQGNFPFHSQFSKVHPRFQTPVNSILFKVFFASLMILFLNPDRITDIAMFSMYLFYAMVFFGIFKVRKTLGAPTAGMYRVPFYPVIPLFACGGVLYICYSMLTTQTTDALASLGVAALGFPIFYLKGRNS